MYKRTFKIKKIQKGVIQEIDDEILVESPITIKINGNPIVKIICLPKDLKELSIGFLYTMGLIDSFKEIDKIEVNELENEIDVFINEKIQEKIEDFKISSFNQIIKKIYSIPTIWRDFVLDSIKKSEPISNVFKVSQEIIFKSISKMQSKTNLFKKTGGCHGSALFDLNGGLINIFEDIGRHNAIDKVIGSALMKNTDFKKTIICSTGRLTCDSALKAARSKIPILASISAAIESGIRIAFIYNITLIGFVRGRKMNIYTHPDRIVV